jgi:hypothetical protein
MTKLPAICRRLDSQIFHTDEADELAIHLVCLHSPRSIAETGSSIVQLTITVVRPAFCALLATYNLVNKLPVHKALLPLAVFI